MQIQDKVFVVTGGGNGMGREVALGDEVAARVAHEGIGAASWSMRPVPDTCHCPN